MRWTDLPPDSQPADGGPSGLRRSEWEQLRQRLERLPAGHPSSLDDETTDDDGWQDDAQEAGDLDGERTAGKAADPPPRGHDAETVRRARPEGAARPARRGGGRGGDGAGAKRGRHDGWPGAAAAAAGAREPYRPWFASGESAEPWFVRDSQPGLTPPGRDHG